MSYNVILDLEMCKVPKNYRSRYKYSTETIQIGAVLLDESFETVKTFTQYVHPEHGVVDTFIEKMTGIRNSVIKEAPNFKEAIHNLIDWIGDCEFKIYAWSGSDRSQILHEMRAKHIEDEEIEIFLNEENWIDYQDVFTKRFELNRSFSLQEALDRTNLEPKGKLHDGLDDAINTGRLIKLLESDPEIKLTTFEIPEESEGSFGCTIGDLFANFKLE